MKTVHDEDESTQRRDHHEDPVGEATAIQPMPMEFVDLTCVDSVNDGHGAADIVDAKIIGDDAVTEERPSAAKVGVAASPSMMDTAKLPASEAAAGQALIAHPDGLYRDDDPTEYRPSPAKIATAPIASPAKMMTTGASPLAGRADLDTENTTVKAAQPPRLPDFDDDVVTELIDPLIARARERIGQVLREKWRLDGLLGVGGMAAVYLATHRNGARVAIKMLHAELSNNAQVQGRFRREGRVANAVGHDGVVKVIDDDIAEDGSAFLVLELLDGETLEERRVRKGGTLSEDEVLRAADQLLDVLIAAHARGVVHRDLKPENVFLTRSGAVRVLDFGIARLREVSTRSTATQMGSSMGTPQYMPPEQARGLWDQVDGRSDIWAVGATLFTLLTGQLVHNGRTTNEVLLAAMTKRAPPVASVATNVSHEVARVVDRALAFERENRWLDAARMQEAVRHAYLDRFGKPITTSPKLVAPHVTPDEDMTRFRPIPAGLVARRQPRNQLGLSRPVLAVVAGGATLILVSVVALMVAVSRHDASATQGAGAEPTRGATPVATAPVMPVYLAPASTPMVTVASGTSETVPTADPTATIRTVDPSSLPTVAAPTVGAARSATVPPAATPLPVAPYAAASTIPTKPAPSVSTKPLHAGAGAMDGE